MTLPRRSAVIALGLLLSAALGAGAQTNGSATKPASPLPEEKLSPGERANRIDHALEQMHSQMAAMEKLVQRARSEKDIIRLDCVNAKVNQTKGLLRITEQTAVDLREASARGDDEASLRLYTKATLAARKVAQERQDAEQCVGQLAYYTDDKTHVEVEVPPGLPSGDPTYSALPTAIDNRPSPASGF